MNNYPEGIDVSDYQGKFDWELWKGHIDFAFIRAGVGPSHEYPQGYHDTQFLNNWKAIKEVAGGWRAAYWFFMADHDPAKQARTYAEILHEAGFEADDKAALDFEQAGANATMSVTEQAFAAHVFAREFFEVTGRHIDPVYSNPSFIEAGYLSMLTAHPLWISNYDVPMPFVPKPWRTWTFWQYTGTNLDRDVFNGSSHELDKYFTR